jgi:hypothetical protein
MNAVYEAITFNVSKAQYWELVSKGQNAESYCIDKAMSGTFAAY